MMMKRLVLAAAVLWGSALYADEYYNDSYNQGTGSFLEPQHYGTGFYVGAAYGGMSVEDDYYEYFPLTGLSVQTDIDYNTLMFQAGFQYNAYIAMEFRYWFSMGDGDYDISSGDPLFSPPIAGSYSDMDVWGLYLKPMYPINNEFSVYGLLGFSGVSVTGEPGWDLLDDNDFSWGLGASYAVTPNFVLFADYTSLYDDAIDYYDFDYEASQDTTVDSFNVGVSYRF
jgi:opacity protein-like surface antigen